MSKGRQRTQIAGRVDKLKSASLRAIATRERLPHQLFWSLFHLQVAELKQFKEKDRELRRILLGIGM